MDISEWSPRLPALLALLQVPWFILLSIARVRAGGTSALPEVRRIDRLMPLPAFVGAAVAVTLLVWQSWHGGPWLWIGGLACVGLSALFLRVILK